MTTSGFEFPQSTPGVDLFLLPFLFLASLLNFPIKIHLLFKTLVEVVRSTEK